MHGGQERQGPCRHGTQSLTIGNLPRDLSVSAAEVSSYSYTGSIVKKNAHWNTQTNIKQEKQITWEPLDFTPESNLRRGILQLVNSQPNMWAVCSYQCQGSSWQPYCQWAKGCLSSSSEVNEAGRDWPKEWFSFMQICCLMQIRRGILFCERNPEVSGTQIHLSHLPCTNRSR